MKNYDALITELVDRFVADLTQLARDAARATIDAALERSLGAAAGRAPSPQGAGRGRGRAAAPARAKRPRGAKRPAAELAQIADNMLAFITSNPGLRIEQINANLGTTTADVALPLRKLVADGVLRTEGARRATRYYPGSGQRRAAAPRGRKKKS